MRNIKIVSALLALLLALPTATQAARIKDISTVSGMRDNSLIGYGLMVGLNNSGDRSYKTPFTIQTLLSMLKRLGTTVDINQLTRRNMVTGSSDVRSLRDVRVENVAAVMVTATLPPFARPGQKLDIQVSSLGDARSLEGGTLLMTPLKAADGSVYAVAQGQLPKEKKKERARRNQGTPTNGVIQGGAVVEKGVGVDFQNKSSFTLLLNRPDFSTANAVVGRINGQFGAETAKGVDAGTVEVKLPDNFEGGPFGFLSQVEVMEVERDTVAKVVLDQTSGTVVIGENVEINNVAVSIGGMTVEISSPFRPDTKADDKEQLNVLNKNADINELVRALNALGVAPQDLVSVFRSLRAAGALNAELEVL